MESIDRYPLGQQDFKILRERGLVYIDKTEYIRKIVEDRPQYLFLARPRRFGKSLFLSTLQCFFEGQRELFKGLSVDSMDWDWERHPVIHIDLNPNSYDEQGRLDNVLNDTYLTYSLRHPISLRLPLCGERDYFCFAESWKIA